VVRTLILAGAAAVAACGGAPPPGRGPTITVADAYAAEPVSLDVAAVYLTIENAGDETDTLVSAQTPIARAVDLHRMMGMGGPTQMRAVQEAAIPAHGQLRLRPGGMHLMLMDLTTRLHAGDTIDLTLVLRHGGSIPVRAPVLSYLEVGERAAVGSDQQRR
jgi:copper(I)-binding protein